MSTRADADDFIYGESQVTCAGAVGAAGHTPAPGRAPLVPLDPSPPRGTSTRPITGRDKVSRQLEMRFSS